MDQTGYAVHHVVCQSFVRRTGLPHAGVNAIVLPHVTRLMAGRAPRALALLDQALGGPGEPAGAEARVRLLTARAGATRLRGLAPGLADPAEAIRAAAAEAAGRPELAGMPDAPDAEQVAALLEAAW
jgi:alcohol dehydrogenase class IV